MRIVITTLGSLGDVQPFVALAAELRRHGHHCVFALPLHLLPYAQRLGFEARQLGPDLRQLFEQFQRSLFQGKQIDDQASAYRQAMLVGAPRALRELRALCAEADLVIGSEIMPLAYIVHEISGIPFVYVRASYPRQVAAPDALDEASLAAINLFRVQLSLPPLSNASLRERSDYLALFALSREVLPALPSWPKHFHVTGFFFLDEEQWQPEPDLVAFLQAGPPPVVISLGSTMHDDPAQLTALFLAAIDAVGCRTVIQHGSTGLVKGARLPQAVYAADYIPHAWLFARAACVVHHGGAGTSAATFRAGVPTVVIPHAVDEFVFARYAHDLGCASGVFPYQTLSVNQLSAAISSSLTDTRYRAAAAALSKRIQAEQGVQTARALIEQFAGTVAWRASK